MFAGNKTKDDDIDSPETEPPTQTPATEEMGRGGGVYTVRRIVMNGFI